LCNIIRENEERRIIEREEELQKMRDKAMRAERLRARGFDVGKDQRYE
jgi:hypothetical protein